MPKKSVLLVDDDAVFLEAASAILESRFEVRTAANGKEALAALEHALPDAVVLDVMMDHIAEGYDVARQIKQNPRTRDLPIIMLTGVDEVYNLRIEIDEAALPYDRFLQKPVSPERLLATIGELLA